MQIGLGVIRGLDWGLVVGNYLLAVDGAHVHDVVGAVLVNVGRSAVASDVHACNLVLRGDSEETEFVQGVEQRAHCDGNPPGN